MRERLVGGHGGAVYSGGEGVGGGGFRGDGRYRDGDAVENSFFTNV